MHLKNILHNDIKTNNVLLKSKEGNWIPKLMDMGKVILKSEPEVYRLSPSRTEKYNKKYPHLADELRNISGAKISFAIFIHLDIFLRIYLLKYRCIKF